MVFRKKIESQDHNDTHRREIVTSLEKTGLDREKILVLGGGALALAGVRRANDLDLMVPHSVFSQLEYDRRTPSGLHLQNKYGAHGPFLETIPFELPEDVMAVDITHPHDDLYRAGSPELDDEFLATIKDFDSFEGFTFLPPELVAVHKNRPDSPISRKNRKDLRLIKDFLKNQKM